MVTSVTNEVWLTREQIDEDSSTDHSPVAEMLTSSSSQPPVGGVLSVFDHVTGTNVELQRIISRCRCQLFYASYGPVNMNEVKEIPPTVSYGVVFPFFCFHLSHLLFLPIERFVVFSLQGRK